MKPSPNDPRPAAFFLAESPGLDFLNSVATPSDARVDWLDSGAGLVAWLDQAGLVPSSALAEIRSRALLGELDSVAAQARNLREWFRGFVNAHKGKPLAVSALSALDPLNRLLARDESFYELAARARRDGGGIELRTTRRWRSADSLLLPIGEALAKTLCEEDFGNVRACEGSGCTLLFADHTRGHARRWCSMAVCGNRAKVAAHRQRQKDA
jgi:predicted RNA-binding Zn ribbon-like protein